MYLQAHHFYHLFQNLVDQLIVFMNGSLISDVFLLIWSYIVHVLALTLDSEADRIFKIIDVCLFFFKPKYMNFMS